MPSDGAAGEVAGDDAGGEAGCEQAAATTTTDKGNNDGQRMAHS